MGSSSKPTHRDYLPVTHSGFNSQGLFVSFTFFLLRDNLFVCVWLAVVVVLYVRLRSLRLTATCSRVENKLALLITQI